MKQQIGGEIPNSVCLLASSFSFHSLTGKGRERLKGRRNMEESTKLEHWRVGGTEARTSSGQGKPSQASGDLGPALEKTLQ